jgi:glutaredoxin 3
MSAPKVVMYGADWCGYCARARALLSTKGVVFEEIDTDLVPGARQEAQARSGRSTIPQIFIGDQYVGGADDLAALEAAGRLDSLLNNTEP